MCRCGGCGHHVGRGFGEARPAPGACASHTPAPPQIAEERKKTQLAEAARENTVKKSQPKPGSQGPPTYRQGVGKYINPAAT